MSNRFKIGQMVVALNNAPNKKAQPRIKGKIYEVKALKYCVTCGTQTINIGERANTSTIRVKCKCGDVSKANGLHWTDSKYFAPLEENEEENEELESMLESIGIDIKEKVLR